MKKTFLGLLFTVSLGSMASGQISQAGLPVSMLSQIPKEQFTPLSFPLPNWEQHNNYYKEKITEGLSQLPLIGLFTPTDIRFPSSGYMTELPDGRKIWRASVQIAGAPAIGFYYDRFRLPEGARLYLHNGNGNQVLGAYTDKNNSEDYMFANEAVQGDMVHIELDIQPGVLESDIELHINRALVYFESVSYLKRYAEDKTIGARPAGEPDPYQLEGRSSRCMINAVCEQAAGYEIQRKSTVQIIIPNDEGASVCSGTMVNNTGANETTCRPFLLTASHCDKTGDVTDVAYSQWMFRFNFEQEECTGGPAATVNTLNGAYFRARSSKIAMDDPDFLLLELKDAIPASWDVYFSGWDVTGNIPNVVNSPQKYIAFHHPAGDIKKLLVTQRVQTNMKYFITINTASDGSEGGVAPGSSGSGFFNPGKQVIGITSVAGNPLSSCGRTNTSRSAIFFTAVFCYKLFDAWEPDDDKAKQLKFWLDPVHSGALTTEAVKACNTGGQSTGIITNDLNKMEDNIAIYPNPVTNGVLKVKTNFKNNTYLDVIVSPLSGSGYTVYHLQDMEQGTFALDLSDRADGIYIIKFISSSGSFTRKIVINRQ